MSGRSILAAGMLAGTIIGAGVFALPYVVGTVGIATGLFYLCGAALVYYVVHRMYAAVLAEAPRGTQFFGLARMLFSPRVAPLASYLILGELLFVMVVYLALAPAFIELLVPWPRETAVAFFWFFGSLFVFARLVWQGVAELLGTLFIAGIVGVVLFAGGAAPLAAPAFRPLDPSLFFLPLGPLLFSFSGRPALHAVVEEWRRAKEEHKAFSLRRVIAWGTFIPAAVYSIFIVAVLRLAPDVAPEALASLQSLPLGLLAALGGMGLVTLWTSYFMIGSNVKDIVHLDLKLPAWAGALLTLAAPLGIYLAGFNTFFSAIAFTGSVFLGLEGILVVMLWRRAFPVHRFRALAAPLALVFMAALGYELLSRFSLV
ncbi:MAG: hypothetical protein HYU81_01875 [Candidatus Brennerbacteria bacterium]|nr:hypothetical protein [Candidatus Brennerbacteria bacterium]